IFVATHTYLDGICRFTSLGVWALGTLHSMVLSIQSAPAACMGMHRLDISQSHHGHS
ncbi:hypothetical protein DFH07DRAFT_705816, partial [Mycena maculata]